MKWYIAAKFEEGPRARHLMDRLEEMGHEITHDWTRADPATAGEALQAAANDDLDGVLAAEGFVLLWHPKLQGGLVELGVALTRHLNPPAIIGAPAAAACIFFRLCEHFDTVDAFMGSLLKAEP